MGIPELGAAAGVTSLGLHFYRLLRERPRLRVSATLCDSRGTYVRGGGGLTHLNLETLNAGMTPVVFLGFGVEAKARIPLALDDGGSSGGWSLQGDKRVRLDPGERHRMTIPLAPAICDLRHELVAIWAEDTLSRRTFVPRRRVNAIQHELFVSYCVDHPAEHDAA